MPVGPVLVCFIWTLDTVYASETNTKIPLVAARVPSGWEASAIYDVHVSFSLAASSSNYVYFTGGATITYGDANVLDYSADIYTLAISDSSFKLNGDIAMSPYDNGPGIAVVSFKGDYALARYKEQICYTSYDPPRTYCNQTGNHIILYMVRPNPIQPPMSCGEVLPLDSWVGDVFNLASKYWNNRTEYGGFNVSVNSFTTAAEATGMVIFSVAVPLINPPPGVEVSGNFVFDLAAGIGTTKLITVAGVASAALNKDDQRYRTYAVYYLPPVKFEYQGGYYPLPSLFVDVEVDVTAPRG